jgi:ABC-type methionine transport system ATPase subunit
MIIERKVRLTYPERLLDQPLIYGLSHNFQLSTNILEAEVDAQQGVLVVIVRGKADEVERGLAWMSDQGVEVEVLSGSEEGA